MVTYLLQVGKMFYGLFPMDVRTLAYGYAKKVQLNIPESWVDKQIAEGLPVIWSVTRSYRTGVPRPTCLARASAVSKKNVDIIFKNLEPVIDRV